MYPMYLLKAAVLFAAIMRLAFRHRRGRHPFAHFGAANQVTTVRAALVALMAALIGEPPSATVATMALVFGVTATVLDGVDGWLARRTGMASQFGARFDMEVDALLIQVLAILAWTHGKAGWWVLLSGLLRYIFVASGWVLPWMARPLASSRRGKVVCVVQIAALMVVLLPAVTPPASVLVAAFGLAALSWSFAVDTRRLWLHR
jgi:phosphatidylglycerophosphate synthase